MLPTKISCFIFLFSSLLYVETLDSSLSNSYFIFQLLWVSIAVLRLWLLLWKLLSSCDVQASLVADHGPWGSAVVVHGLSCPEACGIFLDQGLNQLGEFLTTRPPGKPPNVYFTVIFLRMRVSSF